MVFSQKNPLWLSCAGLLIALIMFMPAAHAKDEPAGKLIETFTLDRAHPKKEFFQGKLKIELLSITEANAIRSITVRITSRALTAEYGDPWQDHVFLEMLKYYKGNPISGSPFKCLEGWVYYKKSDNSKVILSLHENPHMSGTSWYEITVQILEKWKYFVMALGYLALAIFVYYYGPLFWGFLWIQHLARRHALATRFDSSPLTIYIIKKAPLAAYFYAVFILFFDYGWKGVAASALMAVALQLYFNYFNKKQLTTYAREKRLTVIENSGGRAYAGSIRGTNLSLAVGGTFMHNPYYQGDLSSGGPHIYFSYLVMEAELSSRKWNDLVLVRGKKSWTSNRQLKESGIDKALAALMRLPRYSIGRIEVRENKLMTLKIFAPDSPTEIHLLADLFVDLARALERA